MKTLPEEALDQIEGDVVVQAGAFKIAIDPPAYLWSGYGEVQIEGHTYKGIGDQALVTPTSSQIGGANDGLTISVNGLDPDVTDALEGTSYHQKPATVYRLIFAQDRRTLLGAAAYVRGRIDTIEVLEEIGGKSSIDVKIEGPRRDMNRRGSRMRSDTDQRALTGDPGMKHVGIARRKTLNWGQRGVTTPGIGGPRTLLGITGRGAFGLS